MHRTVLSTDRLVHHNSDWSGSVTVPLRAEELSIPPAGPAATVTLAVAELTELVVAARGLTPAQALDHVRAFYDEQPPSGLGADFDLMVRRLTEAVIEQLPAAGIALVRTTEPT